MSRQGEALRRLHIYKGGITTKIEPCCPDRWEIMDKYFPIKQAVRNVISA